MNANTIINDSMTLDEKLEAIDRAMQEAITKVKSIERYDVPIDPADLLTCEGCQ